MNLNQAAHGDREFGLHPSRAWASPRKTVVGHVVGPGGAAAKVGTWAARPPGWAAHPRR